MFDDDKQNIYQSTDFYQQGFQYTKKQSKQRFEDDDNCYKNNQDDSLMQLDLRVQARSLNSASNNSPQYKLLVYENKIIVLNDRLQCTNQQVQNLKKTNTILFNKLSMIEQLDEQLQNQKIKNHQLREQVQIYRQKIQTQKQYSQDKIKIFKEQLQQKQKFVELMREQHQKSILKKQEQINFLRQALKEKITRLDKYEKKLHNMQIQRLTSQEDYQNFTQRDSRISGHSKSERFSSVNSQNKNTLNTQNSTISIEQKAKFFMKKDQNQLKIMMKSLSNAQKCLQIGGKELSMIGAERQQQKSMMNGSRLAKSKINKTYYK